MNKIKRTAHCKNCGGVLLKITPNTGSVTYNCLECNSEIATVPCDDFETLLPKCNECEGEVFKVRITMDGDDNSKECWNPECENCKGSPLSVYVNNEMEVIDEEEREQLLIIKALEDLEDEVIVKNEVIEQLEEEVDSLSNEIEEKDNYIYHLKCELAESLNRVAELEDRVAELEWRIKKL